MNPGADAPSYLDLPGRRGLGAWVTSLDHKRIGLLYLAAMLTLFFVGAGIGLVMRLVQLTAFHGLVSAQTYNALFTVHGVIMIFLFVIPGLPAVFGVFLLGFSSMLTGINFITTIHRLRAPGMTAFRMPLFVWSLYATAFSSLAIAGVGSLVWGHHMFTSGMSEFGDLVFSLLTMLVAIPSAIKVFNWVSTLYKGSINFQPPLLYACTFLFLFSIGGLTGVIQGALSVNVHLHDTYWIVGHFHYVIFGGTGFGFFAALLYWFPKMFGRTYSRAWATVAWVPLFTGFNLLYGGMLWLGVVGMPRRYYAHLPQYHTGHVVATVGSWLLVLGLLMLFGGLACALVRGRRAGPNPWHGVTLEWQVASPPPPDNFHELPTVTTGPYVFPAERRR